MEAYGRRIKDFKIGKVLGTGASAEVFEAVCLQEGFKKRKVAIKKIGKDSGKNDERVEREIQLHSKLRDDSIVTLYTSFEDESYWYLVMELCAGGSLDKYLKREGNLPEEEAYKIIIQVIKGVETLHINKIIHRDLSLRNILLTDYGVKIADFGLAYQLHHAEETVSNKVGTASFMAPEVSRRQPYNFKADWWSVGCILYALLYGIQEFKHWKKTQINCSISFPNCASKEAKKLLTDWLKENPDDRIGIKDAEKYEFFQKYKNGGDSGVSSNSSCRSLNSPLIQTSPRRENYSKYNASNHEYVKRSYYNENHGNQLKNMENARPRIRHDSLVRSNSKRNMSSEQSKSKKASGLGKTLKSEIQTLPSQNESYEAVLSKKSYSDRRDRPCKSTNYQVDNLIQKDGPRNQHKAKIHTSSLPKESSNGPLLKQSHLASRNKGFYAHQSNQHIFNDSDGLESQYDPSIRSCPKILSYPSQIQNLSDKNWNVDSYESGHSVSNASIIQLHLANTNSRDSVPKKSSQNLEHRAPDFNSRRKVKSSQQHNTKGHKTSNSSVNCDKEKKKDIGAENKGVDRSSRAPLSIARLKNCRICKNNFVFSIFGDDDKKKVCLELFEKSEEKKLLFFAIFISHDGMEITVFILKKLKILVSDKPPTVNLKTKKSWQEVECFTFQNLPEKYWKKYENAKLCVDMRKRITPKVIIYEGFGKCIMMENSPNNNFEMHYYGYKVTESDGKITIKNKNGIEVTKSNHEQMLNEFEQMKCTCKDVEKFGETNPRLTFPAMWGRSNARLSNQDSNKENSNPKTMQSSLLSEGTAIKSFDFTDNGLSQFSYLKGQSTSLFSEKSYASRSKINRVLSLENWQWEKVEKVLRDMNERVDT